jgi:plastocyanin
VIAVVVVTVAVVFYIATVSAAATTTSTSLGQSSGPPAVQVSIYSGAANSANPPGYIPDNLTLVVGINNTVTWTNNDSAHHTVTSTSAPSGGSFNSGNMNGGATYTHTFTVPGTYKYDCIYHSWMTGTLIVKPSS